MMTDREERLGELFQRSIEGGDEAGEHNVVEQVVATANQQTGLRDMIALFVSSIFALLIGLIGPLCAQRSAPDQSKSNDTAAP